MICINLFLFFICIRLSNCTHTHTHTHTNHQKQNLTYFCYVFRMRLIVCTLFVVCSSLLFILQINYSYFFFLPFQLKFNIFSSDLFELFVNEYNFFAHFYLFIFFYINFSFFCHSLGSIFIFIFYFRYKI